MYIYKKLQQLVQHALTRPEFIIIPILPNTPTERNETPVRHEMWRRKNRYPRKKKCIRYMEAMGGDGNMGGGKDDQYDDMDDDMDDNMSDDNLGSCGSIDDNHKTPDADDNESLNQSLSSPGCLSGLSSLQSPSTSLASPLNLLTSPATPAASAAVFPNSLPDSQLQQQHQQQQLQNLQQQQQHHLQALSPTCSMGMVNSMSAAIQQGSVVGQNHNSQGDSAMSSGLYENCPPSTIAMPNASASSHSLAPKPPSSFATISTSATRSACSSSTSASSSLSSSSSSSLSIPLSSGGSTTSSSSSATSLSDRMMRSLLSTSPAMLLGNRFSHLAMHGLTAEQQQQQMLHPLQLQTTASSRSSPTISSARTSQPQSSTAFNSIDACDSLRSATGMLDNTAGRQPAQVTAKLDTGTRTSVPPNLASARPTGTGTSPAPSVISSNASSPSGEAYYERSIGEGGVAVGTGGGAPLNSSHTRNPIGANPRDVNNPLSINQLTKRGTSGQSTNSSTNSTTSITSITSSRPKTSPKTSSLEDYNRPMSSPPRITSNTATIPTESSSVAGANMGRSSSKLPCISNGQHEHPYLQQHQQLQQHFQRQQQQQQYHQQYHTAGELSLPHQSPSGFSFSNNISQHFQQQFGHHLAAAAAAAAAAAHAVASQVPNPAGNGSLGGVQVMAGDEDTATVKSNIIVGGRSITDATNTSVPSAAATTKTENGAISVT